jgi:hypothetical protein
MPISAAYKQFMSKMLDAASTLFFHGQSPQALGLPVSADINIAGTGLDGQQHLDFEKGLCYVQVSELVTDLAAEVPLLTKFALAHEFGHICASEIGGEIGTAGLNLGSQKHEVAADLIGTCLLLKLGYTPIMITSVLGGHTGDFVMDEEAKGTHPSRKSRLGFITTLFTKIRSLGRTEVVAIKEVLDAMPA